MPTGTVTTPLPFAHARLHDRHRLSAIVVRKVVGKIISLVVTLGLVATLWGQRSAIKDCVDKAKAQARSAIVGTPADITCSFFGTDVRVPLKDLQGG